MTGGKTPKLGLLRYRGSHWNAEAAWAFISRMKMAHYFKTLMFNLKFYKFLLRCGNFYDFPCFILLSHLLWVEATLPQKDSWNKFKVVMYVAQVNATYLRRFRAVFLNVWNRVVKYTYPSLACLWGNMVLKYNVETAQKILQE